MSINLDGGGRQVEFRPGLNIITGPISSGKTTLLRLCRLLLSSGIDVGSLGREVRQHVPTVSGRVSFGDIQYDIRRPVVSTDTVKVEIASSLGEAWRLPASRQDATSKQTYGQWLLQTLGLPEIRLPTAPTKDDSDLTPITINDYFIYCVLAQHQIDHSVFDHLDPFKNIKRKYVFEILYGLRTPEMTILQDELRLVNLQIRDLTSGARSFERFLRGTAWENRAVLDRDLIEAHEELTSIEEQSLVVAAEAPRSSAVETLHEKVSNLDHEMMEMRGGLRRERSSVDELQRLANQLEAQATRLTRAIVADTFLVLTQKRWSSM